MKQNIVDKKFILKSIIYIIVWAIFAKLVAARLTADSASFESIVSAAAGNITRINYYIVTALGALFILYGTGLTIYEALTHKGFFWVWGRNWGASGLGGVANSFAFLGIGVGLLGTTVNLFIGLLIIICVFAAALRIHLMRRGKKGD